MRLTLICLLTCAGPMFAQRSGNTETWTGLLVAEGCQSAGSANSANKAVTDGEMAKSTPGAGREHNTTYEQKMNQADRGSTSSSAADPTMSPRAADRANSQSARNLDKSCHIGPQTTSFALRLPAGRLIAFDAASNIRIAKQLQSSHKLNGAKIFHAVAKGSLQNNALSLDSIRFDGDHAGR